MRCLIKVSDYASTPKETTEEILAKSSHEPS